MVLGWRCPHQPVWQEISNGKGGSYTLYQSPGQAVDS